MLGSDPKAAPQHPDMTGNQDNPHSAHRMITEHISFAVFIGSMLENRLFYAELIRKKNKYGTHFGHCIKI